MKKAAILTLVTLISIQISWAQKYGHLNLGNVVAQMPATKAADAEIKAYSDQLIAQGQEMAKKLQADYAEAVNKIQSGTISPIEQQELEKKLNEEQASIQAFEAEVQQKIAAKREVLLKPIFDEVEKAIADVAKKKGMTMVFDTSMFNTIMFAADSADIIEDVKAVLGIK
ncbi:MAG: OmpH family outer membrane protein [Bacteroidota bacterium]